MHNGPSLGYSCVENGGHPVSAALDFLDEGSGSFCGDTYYLHYLGNSVPLYIWQAFCAMETIDHVSVQLIFKPLPWALVMTSSTLVPGCLYTKAILLRTQHRQRGNISLSHDEGTIGINFGNT
jgi:hypothetical protein